MQILSLPEYTVKEEIRDFGQKKSAQHGVMRAEMGQRNGLCGVRLDVGGFQGQGMETEKIPFKDLPVIE